ncbi:hypothetical protein CRG98_003340 [Punica granatum]|uniref:Beta-amyrin 28-monooxygenase-like n=1 Tax=Punica granatum TaxID=22663 RepID=A0A2I0L689_PUNGR|nr:hypothetical protein CRG98_003340 [Punica granatum]
MDLFCTCVLYLAILSLTIHLVRKHKAKAHGTTDLLNLPPGKTGYWPIIRETLDFVMAGCSSTPEKFVTDRTSRYSSDVFRTSLLGVGENVAISAELLATSSSFLARTRTAYNKAIQAGKTMRSDLLSIIRRRKKEIMEKDLVANHLLSRMLLAEDENGRPVMKETDISHTITFVVKYLAEYPDVYEQVLKKMRYSWMVDREAMRLSPGAFREAITDFTYSGFTIPKGWKTHWTVRSTHKDPRYFPDPERFDPSRFEGGGPAPFSFVPFGGRPRMCLGKEYDRVQILVFMHNVVTKFKWKKAIPDEKIIYSPNPVPAGSLPIRIEQHI